MAVVPYYFLVWYNNFVPGGSGTIAVVPYYFLVWYNLNHFHISDILAVVPYYFLVWYNQVLKGSCTDTL